MILQSFGEELPFWIAPLNTIILLGIFLFLSWREIKLAEKLEAGERLRSFEAAFVFLRIFTLLRSPR